MDPLGQQNIKNIFRKYLNCWTRDHAFYEFAYLRSLEYAFLRNYIFQGSLIPAGFYIKQRKKKLGCKEKTTTRERKIQWQVESVG